MLNYETIKRYFECGYWTEAMVMKAAQKGIITTGQAEGIVGTGE